MFVRILMKFFSMKAIENMENIAKNIEEIRKTKGFSRAKLELLTGIKNLYQKEKGIRPITELDIKKLAKALDCSVVDIAGIDAVDTTTIDNIKLIKKYDIRYMKNMDLSDDDNVIETLIYDVAYLKKDFGTDDLIIVKCHNSLMHPFLQYDDNLFIDLQHKKFINNAVYLIRENNTNLVIKRAYKKELHKNTITLSYDNTIQGAQTTEIMEDDFFELVVGRVVYIGRNIRDL